MNNKEKEDLLEQLRQSKLLIKIQSQEIDKLSKFISRSFDEKRDLLNERRELKDRVLSLSSAMAWFNDRVEKGEVRSRRTYLRFKELLKDDPLYK